MNNNFLMLTFLAELVGYSHIRIFLFKILWQQNAYFGVVKREVLSKKLVNGLWHWFSQVGLQVLEKLRLVASSDNQTPDDEKHQKESCEVSPGTLELIAVEKDRQHVHRWSFDSSSINEVPNFLRREVDDLNGCKADR